MVSLGNLDLSTVFSPNMFNIIGLVLTILSVVIGIAALVFLLYYITRYNIRIEYFDKRKNINRLRFTKAKKIVEDGIPKLKIWMKKGSPLKLPDTNIVFKVGKKDKIFMTRDFAGHYNFVEWKDTIEEDKLKTKFEEVPPEARLWESLQYRKNIARFQKQSFWDKYGNLIIQYGFIVVVIFMLILLASKFKVVADQLTEAIRIGQECQRLG